MKKYDKLSKLANMNKEIKPVPVDIPDATYTSKVLENLMANNPPSKGYIDEMVGNMYSALNQQLEDKLKEVFQRLTGEELTEENASRVTVIIPPHTSSLSKREIYHIDNTPVFTLLPIQLPEWNMGDSYKVNLKREYIDHI